MDDMTLEQAIKEIDVIHKALANGKRVIIESEYGLLTSAYSLVLSAAEKQIEDGPKAERWDAQMWYWNLKLKDVWQYFPYHSDCTPSRDEILAAYRKAQEGKE